MTEPIRFSRLKWMAESPAHYRYAATTEWPASPSMQLGTAVHRYMEGRPLPVYPGSVRRGKEWDAWAAANGPESVTATDDATARAMVAAVRAHPLAGPLMAHDGGAVVERTIRWTFDGREAQSTPDLYRTGDNAMVVDLKTCRSANPRYFIRDAIRYHYHAQLAFYRQAIAEREECVASLMDAYIVAVESRPPHPVVVLRLTARALNDGLALCYLWSERLRVCEDANHWPAYSDAAVELDTTPDDELIFGDEEA